jgi:hypothetical protein
MDVTPRHCITLGAVGLVLASTVFVTAGTASGANLSKTEGLGPATTLTRSGGETSMTTGLSVGSQGVHHLRLELSEPYRTTSGTPLFQVRGEGADLTETDPAARTALVSFPVTVNDGVLDIELLRVPNRVQIRRIEAVVAPVTSPVAATSPTPSPSTTTSPTTSTTTSPTTSTTTSPTTTTTSPTLSPSPSPTTSTTTAPTVSTFPPGTAVPPLGASFPAPTCTRTYQIPNLVNSASSGDNLSTINTAIANAVTGDCLTIPAGTYRRSGNIDVPATKTGITIMGAGRGSTVLLGTSLDRHGFRVLGAKSIRLQGMTIDTVTGGTRTGNDQQGHSTLLLDPGTSGFLGQDLLLRGARAAGFFAYRANNYHLHRVEVQNSLADGFHNTNGSYNGTFTDIVATNPGDDGWAMVAYGGSASTVPRDFTVTRFSMSGNPHGRGFGIVNSYGLTVHGPTTIRDTSAAGILIARETQYGGTMHPVRNIRFLGETRVLRANHNREDHGAVLIDNPEGSQPVEGVYLENLIMTDTGKNRFALPSHNVFVKGSGRISAQLKDFRFVGAGPKSLLGGSRTADSTLTLTGWSTTDGYRAG